MAVEYATTYERSWAIVIGIDRYAGMPPLHHAVADARSVADVLIKRYDFDPAHVIALYDQAATAHAINALLDRLAEPGVIGRNDRMIFFLAGHGLTRREPEGEVGYFAPVDARREDWRTLIRFTDITARSDSIPAKHIFYIMDACYSGHIVLRGLADRASEEFIARLSRQILTAGMENEMVADGGGPGGRNSIFTGHLLDGLRGNAADARGMLSASSLISYVYHSLINDSRAEQTPLGGWLRGDGDFIFRSAAPRHLPAHFIPRMDSASQQDRVHAVADLALLAVAAPPPVGKEALKALNLIAGTDLDELVRTTASYCLREAISMLKAGEPVAASRLEEVRRLMATTEQDAFFVGQPDATSERNLNDARLPGPDKHAASGAIQTPPPTRPPAPPANERPARRKPARRRTQAGLSVMVVAILLLLAGMAGTIVVLIHNATVQAAIIEAMQASAAGTAMGGLLDQQQATLEGTAVNQLLVTKQAEATALVRTPDFPPTVVLADATLAGSGQAVGLAATPSGAPPPMTATPLPPAPTEGPTRSSGPLVYVDDFGRDRGWLLADQPGTNIQVRDGRLVFDLATPFDLWYALPAADHVPVLGDFVLDVEAQELTPQTDGALLILVRGQAQSGVVPADTGQALLDSYICIGVQSSGQAFVFVQTDGQPLRPALPLQTLPQGPLPSGEPLQLRVVALGATLTLYVNGIEALSMPGVTPDRGQIALGVWTHRQAPYRAAFDNLSISLPDY